jgi:predicted lipid-binding transport protein (Tim44 family)
VTHLERPAAVEVHHPVPITPHPPATPLVPVQPGPTPAVQSIVLPDGQVVTGYTLTPAPAPMPVAAPPVVSRTAVSVALGGVGFGAVCGGLFLLTSFIAALSAFITQLITLAAVIFGGWIAVQIFGARSSGGGGTTVHIRKAVIKRSHFHG